MTKAICKQERDGRHLSVLGSQMTVMADADETRGAYEVVLVDAGPGGDIVPHRHPWEESYFVLEGEMEVQVGARRHHLSAGGLVTIPSRALHGFTVTSDHARFLHLSIGAGATAAFEEYAVVSPGAPDVEDLDTVMAILEVNARHGVEVVLPDGL